MRVLARLLTGILAVVFLPLGLAFLVLGDEFGATGLVLTAMGIAFATVFVVLMRKERARRSRRTLRTSAEVVEARIDHGVQLNDKRRLTLTVHLEPAGTVTGHFFWRPADAIGDRVEVEYDPSEPANFAPVAPPE